MFLRVGPMTLIALSFLSSTCYAIIFDASCSVYQEKLEDAFDGAFALADLAAKKLNPPVRDPYSEFAKWLFGDPAGWGEAHTRLGNVKYIPATFSSNKKDKSNLNDVVVYCNMDRYQKIKSGPYRDTDLNELVYADDDFLMCKTGNSINGQRRPKAISNSYTDTNNPDKYLEIVKRSEWTTASDVTSEVDSPTGSETLGTMLVGALKSIAQGLLGPSKKDIDSLALFDHTLLHELTHARAVGKSQTKLGVNELYGWPACTDHPTPYNSDSLAFFALACQIIDDGTAAIGPEGLIETPQASSNNSPGDPGRPESSSDSPGSQSPPHRRRLMERIDVKRKDRLAGALEA